MREDRTTIQDAAWMVMEDAYNAASDDGSLPTRPRQVMYAARPDIGDNGKEQSGRPLFHPDLAARHLRHLV